MNTPTYIVKFGEEDFGLYLPHHRNYFNTPLIFRGTLEDVLEARKTPMTSAMQFNKTWE